MGKAPKREPADAPPEPRTRRRKGRRARGTGSIFYDEARGKWVGRRIVGRTAAGKRLYREVSGKTQAEVVKKLEAAGPLGSDATVSAWAARWIGTLDVRASTLARVRSSVDTHILPALGGAKLAEVTRSRAAAFLNAIRMGPDKDGLAPGSVVNVRAHARQMFDAARLDGLIADNPFDGVKRPKTERKRIDPFTRADLRRLVAAAEDYPAGRLVALLAGVGCRLGEALALDVTDYDPAAGKLSITKTYSWEHGTGPPKSARGVRTVTVPPQVRPALAAAAGGRTAGPLFRTRTGNRYTKAKVQQAFARALKRMGVSYRNPHQMRHSVATHLIAGGCPIADVAAYLGDTVATVVETYCHATGHDPGEDMGRILGA